jgi:hypothetical protein
MDPEGACKGDGSKHSHGAPGTLGPPPTYLRIHRPEGPEGPKGDRRAVVSHSSARGSRPEISFRPAFRLKVSIDKLRG